MDSPTWWLRQKGVAHFYESQNWWTRFCSSPAQSSVLSWLILEHAVPLVGLTEVKSSRILKVKHIRCQKSQFWVIWLSLKFSINSGHQGMNLPIGGFHHRQRPLKRHNFCKMVPHYPSCTYVVPASLCQATLIPLESYLCQLHENRLWFILVWCWGQLAPA